VSLYRRARSPYWYFDFYWRGHRFHRSTKATNKREAEKVEAAERERAKALVAQLEQAKTSLRLADIASRYWTEHAQHLAGAPNTWTLLGILLEYFGKDKLLTEIADDDVARLVAWRRGHRKSVYNTESDIHTFISPFTVNHTTTTLRKLFTRARLWGLRFNHEPRWSKHLLRVPTERVRELSDEEADRLDAAMRPDYAPFIAFARASGLRLNECLLHWSEVDWSAKQIVKLGKGGKRVTVPITSEIADILRPLRGHHSEFVFTYVPQRTNNVYNNSSDVHIDRRPLTYAGVQSFWRRLRNLSGVNKLRFHDLRHDFATKLLRETGNLRLVQKALGHASIKTTERYAHVLDSEVAEAMERVAKSRHKSRHRLKVV
jgi:integrase